MLSLGGPEWQNPELGRDAWTGDDNISPPSSFRTTTSPFFGIAIVQASRHPHGQTDLASSSTLTKQ
jgi:hypothetical protein